MVFKDIVIFLAIVSIYDFSKVLLRYIICILISNIYTKSIS